MLTPLVAAVAGGAAAVLTVPVAGLLSYRQWDRVAASRQLRITDPAGIDDSGFVRIGGIDQWISIRGDDRRNPVLLDIHGGPGASNLIYTPRTRTWERHFTVVRWDMRGSGKTFGRTGPDGQGEMSLDRLYRDAVEVTAHILTSLRVERVVLLAHSFGSVLGLRLARDHPELYSAYVGTDQRINAGGRDHTAYDALTERLRTAGKGKELAGLTALSDDKSVWSTEQRTVYNKLIVGTDPLTLDTMKNVVFRSLIFSPLHNLRDIRTYRQGMAFSQIMAAESVVVDEWAEGTTFEIPFYVFQGERDVMTPPAPARRFFDDVSAPVKDFALIENASHFAAFRCPDQFLHLLLTRVRSALTRT